VNNTQQRKYDTGKAGPGKGDNTMTTTTPPRTPLDGITTCGECAEPMAVELRNGNQEQQYACRPSPGNGWTECGTPKLRAHQADVLIIGEILSSIITEETTAVVLDAATGSPEGDETGEHGLTKREVASLNDRPTEFVSSVGGPARARDFLAGFIDEIQVHPDRVTICYILPLPNGSPLEGKIRQDVILPFHRPTTIGT
jgi:hypothetical protein